MLAQRLAPGTKLGERALTEIFGSSRVVVRQALNRLADEGLVVLERYRGAFVKQYSVREAFEIYDALTAIEQAAAVKVVSGGRPGDWQKLEEHIQLQKNALTCNEDRLADDLGAGFHTLLVSMTRNRLLIDMHDRFTRSALQLRSLHESRFDYCSLVDEHSKIVGLIKRGRLKQLVDLIDTHNRNVVRGYLIESGERAGMGLDEALAPFLETTGARTRVAEET